MSPPQPLPGPRARQGRVHGRVDLVDGRPAHGLRLSAGDRGRARGGGPSRARCAPRPSPASGSATRSSSGPTTSSSGHPTSWSSTTGTWRPSTGSSRAGSSATRTASPCARAPCGSPTASTSCARCGAGLNQVQRVLDSRLDPLVVLAATAAHHPDARVPHHPDPDRRQPAGARDGDPAARQHLPELVPGDRPRIDAMNDALAEMVAHIDHPDVRYFPTTSVVRPLVDAPEDITPDGGHLTPELHRAVGRGDRGHHPRVGRTRNRTSSARRPPQLDALPAERRGPSAAG